MGGTGARRGGAEPAGHTGREARVGEEGAWPH